MYQPAGILKNTKTQLFHPIIFRRAPMPGQSDATSASQRYKSRGHHTDGFETIELANAYISERGWDNSGTVWEWNGENAPAMVVWFTQPVAVA